MQAFTDPHNHGEKEEKKMADYTAILCTCPSKEVACKIADALVPAGLAACVNIITSLISVYRWKGDICRDEECLVIIKSTQENFEDIRKAILTVHPYEVPEIISLPISSGHEPYLRWIDECTAI